MGCGDSTESDDTPSDLSLDFLGTNNGSFTISNEQDHSPKGDEARKLFDQVNEEIKGGPTQLEILQSYSGCEEPIRKALNEPGPKTDQAVSWFSALPLAHFSF